MKKINHWTRQGPSTVQFCTFPCEKSPLLGNLPTKFGFFRGSERLVLLELLLDRQQGQVRRVGDNEERFPAFGAPSLCDVDQVRQTTPCIRFKTLIPQKIQNTVC